MVKRKEQDSLLTKTGSTPRKGVKQKQNKLTEEKKASKIGSKSKTTESAKIANAAENPGTKSTHKSTLNSQSTHSPAVETSNNNHNNYVEDEADPKIRLKSYSSILRKNAKFNGHPEGEATPNKYQTWTQRAVKLKAKEIARTAKKEEKERMQAEAASYSSQPTGRKDGTPAPVQMKKGGKVSSASSRADGRAVKGKTKGRMV